MVAKSLVFKILLLSGSLSFIRCHPQCIDSYPPFEDVNLQYCSQYREFGCCFAERDAELQDLASSILSNFPEKVREDCGNFVKDILCQECSPYAAHIFNMEDTSRADWSDFPGLCTEYCSNFHQTCGQLLPYWTRSQALLNASAESSVAFCEAQMIDDVDYCFPDVLYNVDLNNQVRESQIGSSEDCLCLEEFANNLRNPLALTFANDSTHRIYVIEQMGVVTLFFRNGSYLNDPFLDIQDLVVVSSSTGDERGLLGLAFHPNYAENRKFYVHYTTSYEGTLYSRISELKSFTNDTNRADARTERVLIQVEQPAGNHNGGSLFFDLEGYLLTSLGDGGLGGDPFGEYGNGLNLTTFHGKILRIDVDGRDGPLPYGIPPGNPFVEEDPEMKFHEIFAYGVRNMWRCSVDRGDSETGYGAGRIFCGDVGQRRYEEIDIIVNGGNYGWRAMEGNNCFDRDLCNEEFIGDNYVSPIHVYDHTVGKAVTGGHVYRGCQYPHLQGLYIYGDYWNGRLFKLEENGTEWKNTEICLGTKDICTGNLWNIFPEKILAFGEDETGEVYMLVTDIASSSHAAGKIFRFVDPNKRGNPEECHVEERPVPVFGPISPFEPSNSVTTSPPLDVTTSPPLDVAPNCQSGLEGDTDTEYYYRYSGIPVGMKRIEFEAKANNDVHIALSPSESSSDLYEIVIGGWRNTKSVIRRCKQCTNLVTVATDHYLSANEFRRFWITFSSNGAVAVGREDELTAFMEWTDPLPLDVQYLGYSTGWRSSGEFRFCGLERPECPLPLKQDTNTTFYYRYLEIPVGMKRIEFEAKANNDVHIALSPSESSSDFYEIVIGGWRNTKSVIRRCKQCTNLVTVTTDHYLSANEFRRFWITFSSKGAVAVGREDEFTAFMEWTDPLPLDVQYLGYSTGWRSSGEFRFCGLEQQKCPLPLKRDTDTEYYYRYLEIPVGMTRIEFEAKANNDVHIALSPSESSSDLYEIVIGGWRNTKSVIRRCKQCTNLVTVATDHYLSANEFRRFWITFISNGSIAVGREDELTAFMEWTDPLPLDVQYLGYSTGWRSSGEFRFCGLG